MENLIHHQQNTLVAKVRLLHEIDVCLEDFQFFESHARRELDRAEKVSVEKRERVEAEELLTGIYKGVPDYWNFVRNIISGVEGGISIYFGVLEKYYPEELSRYSKERLNYFLPYLSKHRAPLTGIPAAAYKMKSFETKLEQFEYWQENIAPHVQDREAAAEYWGIPEYLLDTPRRAEFSNLGFAPKQVYEQFFTAWIFDKKVIGKVNHERLKANVLLILTEPLEKKIAANLELNAGSNERLIASELAKCDTYDIDVPDSKIDLSIGGDYYYRILHHVLYREYLLKRLDELRNPKESETSVVRPQRDTKAEALSRELAAARFFELEKVAALTKENQDLLVNSISSNSLPYQIAMLEELRFFWFLGHNFYNKKSKLYSEVSKWLGTSPRNVKGNISVLQEVSGENKTRYTAHLHKEGVKRDYQNLK